jgi:hypothetical protein
MKKLSLLICNPCRKYRRKCYSAFYASENDTKPLLCIDAVIAAASQHRAALQYWLNKLHALEFLIILEKIPKSRFSETAFEFSKKVSVVKNGPVKANSRRRGAGPLREER